MRKSEDGINESKLKLALNLLANDMRVTDEHLGMKIAKNWQSISLYQKYLHTLVSDMGLSECSEPVRKAR